MIAASKKEGDEFVEQKLGFKNFSHFLQVASDQMKLVEIARDTLHKGQMWVDDVGCSDALKRAAEHQSEPEPQTVETLDSQIVLVKGQVYSKGAQYQFNWDSIERTPKLSSWDLWESMGKPRWVCAPMVEQSELPFRLLCKRYGTDLCYTPMFHARLFIEDANYRAEQFTTCKEDKPVIVQFCANDPHIFAAAAQMVAGKCDAVDLNLGCPQGIAKRGRYGSFLMDELQLVYSMVKEAHDKACVPITAKIRVFDDDAKTLQYAKCLQDAGAQLLTVHGRTRENKGRGATPADWSIIKKVKEHVSIPVISNGNVYNRHDAKRCIEETGVDAVMSAEWLRRNPALFSEGDEGSDPFRMATEYLDLCQTYPAPLGYVRAHIFKFLTDVPHGLQVIDDALNPKKR
jgi:tRNA-dihydrouridine synthase 1